MESQSFAFGGRGRRAYLGAASEGTAQWPERGCNNITSTRREVFRKKDQPLALPVNGHRPVSGSCLPGTIKAKPPPSISAWIRYERRKPRQPLQLSELPGKIRRLLSPRVTLRASAKPLCKQSHRSHTAVQGQRTGDPHRSHHHWQPEHHTQDPDKTRDGKAQG